MNKINYQKELEKTLENITKSDIKPSLLLHVCCAPCSSYVLEYLNKYFNITALFYNPNISTDEEYNHRACLLYTSPSPRDAHESRMPSSA